jgi:hypothetical protein
VSIGELQFVELRIKSASRKQLLMRAAFDDPPVFNDVHRIRPPDCGEAVSNHNRGLADGQAIEGLKDQPFRGGIKPRTGLIQDIQDQDGRLPSNGSRDYGAGIVQALGPLKALADKASAVSGCRREGS